MDKDNFAADRQTKAETISLCRVECLEDARLVRGVDAHAGIRDRYEDMIFRHR